MESKKGFTLLEVVVAMGILSISVVALMTLFSSGISTAVRAEEDRQAVQKATLVMNNILSEKKLAPGRKEGVIDERWHWHASVEKHRVGGEVVDDGLLEVRVTVWWAGQRGREEFELSGLYNKTFRGF